MSGTLSTQALTFGQQGSTQPTISQNSASTVWYSSRDSIYNTPGAFANSLVQVSNGTAYIDGLLASQSGGPNSSNAVAVGSSGIVHLTRSQLTGTTSGFGLNLFQSGAQVFDEGGNTVNTVNTVAGSKLFGPTTISNCSSSGGTCGGASSGSVSIAAAATTVTVSTTSVTANSQILITEDSTLGTKLSVTCNTTTGRTYSVTTRTAGTSFVITASAAPTTNPACLSYTIFN